MCIKKALVTGGAGFIGSHVVRALLKQYPDIDIRVMHLAKDNLINLDHLKITLIPGDITNKDDVESAMTGCDAVFHLAAIFALWLPDETIMHKVNVDGSKIIFDTCLKLGIKRIVYTSSYAVFGGQGYGIACNEESSFKLKDQYYSQTKFDAHKLACSYVKKGLDIVIVCPTAPVGPGDYGPTPTGKIFIDTLTAPINILMKTGSNYVDVRDCALGHVLAYEKGRSGESYILGGNNHTMAEVTATVEKVANLKRISVSISPSLLYPAAYLSLFIANHISKSAPLLTPADLKALKLGLWADCSKARKELGLPSRPIEDSVRDAIQWFNDNNYLDEKFKEKLQLNH